MRCALGLLVGTFIRISVFFYCSATGNFTGLCGSVVPRSLQQRYQYETANVICAISERIENFPNDDGLILQGLGMRAR